MNNAIESINSRLNQPEERINEIKVRNFVIIDSENNKEKTEEIKEIDFKPKPVIRNDGHYIIMGSNHQEDIL